MAGHSSAALAVLDTIEELATTLRIAMFATGIPDLATLRGTPHLIRWDEPLPREPSW